MNNISNQEESIQSTQEILKELEALKGRWTELNERLDRMESNLLSEGKRVMDLNMKPAKDSLLRRYRNFFIIGICMAILTPLIFMHLLPDIGVEGWRKTVCMALFWVYFLTAALEDAYLMKKVEKINLITWPVSRVSSEARRLRHRHHVFMASMILMAIITLGFFIYCISHEESVLWGALIGLVVGLAIGIKEYLKIMQAYKQMILEDKDDE